MTIMGVIGIILAMVLINVFVYKGLNPVISGFLCAFLIIVTSGLSFNETMDSSLSFLGMMCGNFLPIFVFGGIMGMLYNASNATKSLGKLIMRPFASSANPHVKRIGTLSMLLIIRVIIGLAGLDNLAIMPLMVFLVTAVFAGCDLPRRHVNCLLIIAGTVGTLVPGVPHQYVVILQGVLPEFNNSGNLIIRWILLLVFIVAAILIMDRIMERDAQKGVHFEAGPLEIPDMEGDDKAPHWILTFIPVVAVYVTYNFLGLNPWESMLVGVVACLILFTPFIKNMEGKGKLGTVVEQCNQGTFTVPLTMVGCMMISNVMAQSPSFDWLCDMFASIPIPSAFGLTLIAIILVGAMGGAQSALVVIGTIAMATFIPNGMSVQAAGIIALWATAVLDTLPNSLGIIMQAQLTGVPMKECYPPIFKTTVLLTGAMSVLVAILAAIGLF